MKTALSWMIAGFLGLSLSQAAYAETPAVATPTVKTPAAVAKPDAAALEAKKAKSKECSDQADAKKLHGKERKEFRAKCKVGKASGTL